MRVIQSYCFDIGKKIPFDKLPGIVETFLREQNLTHRAFHFSLVSADIDDYYRRVVDGSECLDCKTPKWRCEDCREDARRMVKKVNPCHRAAKENPFMGPVHTEETKYGRRFYLNNYQDNSNDSKESIYKILPKLYRRYDVHGTSLIYRDVNFFSDQKPSDPPRRKEHFRDFMGTGITVSHGYIRLQVETVHPEPVPDLSPYVSAMSRLLPKIKGEYALSYILEPREYAVYEALHEKTTPLLRKAEDFFAKRMPEEKGNFEPETSVSNATILKKYCKLHGYTYEGFREMAYTITKKLPNGHYILVEFASMPMSRSADPTVFLTGLGFQYIIWCDGFEAQNLTDAHFYFSKLFETLAAAEETIFAQILEAYPPTPSWFIPQPYSRIITENGDKDSIKPVHPDAIIPEPLIYFQ